MDAVIEVTGFRPMASWNYCVSSKRRFVSSTYRTARKCASGSLRLVFQCARLHSADFPATTAGKIAPMCE